MDKEKPFYITSVCRADMESIGFDVSSLSDEDMEKIASRLGEIYVGNGFWPDLESILIDDYKLTQHEI